MIQSVTQRPRARIDLLEQFVYFGEEESIELAERYFTAVDLPLPGGIDVIRVLHGARDIENLLKTEER